MMKLTHNHFAVLGALPGTKAEIMRKTKLDASVTYNALRSLRLTHQAYISGMTFSARGGPQIPIYCAGQGEDAVKLTGPVAVPALLRNKAACAKIDRYLAKLAGTRAQFFCLLPNARA